MPTILHEQTGLRIQKNTLNGFTVARLHYTADPRKRSPEWAAAARRGMSSASFRQEFEIDYGAHQGEKAFPEILTRREEIVYREPPYLGGWPKDLPMWAGFDYGVRNPSSFHVYTLVDGVVYALWELYEPCKNFREFAAKLLDCPYYKQIRYIVHDPSFADLRSHIATGDLTSAKAHFESCGINKWLPGVRDEQGWLAAMQKYWCGAEIGFRILDCCPQMLQEFESSTFVTMSDRQLETTNYREALVDRNNHALDDCKYFMNSPAVRAPARPLRLPSMVAGYGWSGRTSGSRTSRYSELGI